MLRFIFRLTAVFAILSAPLAFGQIRSSYLDLPLTGQWQANDAWAPPGLGAEAYYDSTSGTLVSIRALPGAAKVQEISKYFQNPGQPSGASSQLLATSEFPLPKTYVEEAAKQIANGQTPQHMWEMRAGEGNPMWFYSSQLFDTYKLRKGGGGAFDMSEQYYPARVVRADHQTVPGGEAILLEVETERAPLEAALKRFHMPASMKDQRIRFTWVQYMPGGVASQQGVLSVAMATPANSGLTADELLKQIASAKLKPAE